MRQKFTKILVVFVLLHRGTLKHDPKIGSSLSIGHLHGISVAVETCSSLFQLNLESRVSQAKSHP